LLEYEVVCFSGYFERIRANGYEVTKTQISRPTRKPKPTTPYLFSKYPQKNTTTVRRHPPVLPMSRQFVYSGVSRILFRRYKFNSHLPGWDGNLSRSLSCLVEVQCMEIGSLNPFTLYHWVRRCLFTVGTHVHCQLALSTCLLNHRVTQVKEAISTAKCKRLKSESTKSN